MTDHAFDEMTNADLDRLAERDEARADLIATAVRLMSTSAIEYDRQRRVIAGQLGCRVSALDAYVKGKAQEGDLAGRRQVPFKCRSPASALNDTESAGELAAKPQLLVQ